MQWKEGHGLRVHENDVRGMMRDGRDAWSASYDRGMGVTVNDGGSGGVEEMDGGVYSGRKRRKEEEEDADGDEQVDCGSGRSIRFVKRRRTSLGGVGVSSRVGMGAVDLYAGLGKEGNMDLGSGYSGRRRRRRRRWYTGPGSLGRRRRDWRGSSMWKPSSSPSGDSGLGLASGGVRLRGVYSSVAKSPREAIRRAVNPRVGGDMIGVLLGSKRKSRSGSEGGSKMGSDRKRRRSTGSNNNEIGVRQPRFSLLDSERSAFVTPPVAVSTANGIRQNEIPRKSKVATIPPLAGFSVANGMEEERDTQKSRLESATLDSFTSANHHALNSNNQPSMMLSEPLNEKEKTVERQKMNAHARDLLQRAKKAEADPFMSRQKQTDFSMMNGNASDKDSLFDDSSVSSDLDAQVASELLNGTHKKGPKEGGGSSSEYEGFTENPLFIKKIARLGIDGRKLAELGIDLDSLTRYEERQRQREARTAKNERELIAVRSTSSFNRELPVRRFKRPLSGARGTEYLDVVYWEGDDAGWDESDSDAIDEKERGVTVLDEEDPLAPMTSTAVKRVRRYMAPVDTQVQFLSPSMEIVELGKVPITRNDLLRLKPNAWLNDEIINYYIELMKKREEERGGKRVYFQNTFFFARLYAYSKVKGKHEYDFTRVRRWTKKVDVFSYEKMIVPINQSNMHWSLCVINFKDKAVEHYDSLGSTSSPCTKVLMKWLRDEAQHKKQIELDEGEWSIVHHGKEIPQQTNSDDCGMFLCKFADYIAMDRELAFDARHMNYFRGRMANEILVQRAA